jgi:hypothetical protein
MKPQTMVISFDVDKQVVPGGISGWVLKFYARLPKI